MESYSFSKISQAQVIPQHPSYFLALLDTIPKLAAFAHEINLAYFPLPIRKYSGCLHFCIFHTHEVSCANLNKCNQFVQVFA